MTPKLVKIVNDGTKMQTEVLRTFSSIREATDAFLKEASRDLLEHTETFERKGSVSYVYSDGLRQITIQVQI